MKIVCSECGRRLLTTKAVCQCVAPIIKERDELREKVFSYQELVLIRSCVTSFAIRLKYMLDEPSSGDALDVRLDEHLADIEALKAKVTAMQMSAALQPQGGGE